MANPVLIEVTRGALVESRHRGSIAIVRADGRALLTLGGAAEPVYPRSAIKVLQAVPLIESGAAEAFALTPAELALACASHSGEPRHVAAAAGMLAKGGLAADALECGAHLPLGEAAAHAFLRSGQVLSQLHNNCSGKHAGMLLTARHLGEPTAGYVLREHPVQGRILAVIEDLAGGAVPAESCGTDGCSVPTWALPLRGLAGAFARIAGGPPGERHVAAGRRLIEAAMAEPEMVAGEARFCTRAMRALAGQAFVKTGAEGVFCAALPGLGLGVALKIDDGATRASEAAMAAVLAALLPAASDAIGTIGLKPVRNVRGLATGEVRAGPELTGALRGLAAAA